MGLGKQAWQNQNIEQSIITGLLDGTYSGSRRANEPSRGYGLNSGVLQGLATGASHGLGSVAALSLADKILPSSINPHIAAALKMVAGPVAGAAAGRLIPAGVMAGAKKLSPPSASADVMERLASLGGTMNKVELARAALSKVANGPDCGDMSGSYGAQSTRGASNMGAAVGAIGGAIKGYRGAPEGQGIRGAITGGLNSGAGGALGGAVGNLAAKALAARLGLSPESLETLTAMGGVGGATVGSIGANMLQPKMAQLAKRALEGSDPLDSQVANQDNRGILRKGHDLLTSRAFKGGPSVLSALSPVAGGAYTRFMENPDEGYTSAAANAAISAGLAQLGKDVAPRLLGKGLSQLPLSGANHVKAMGALQTDIPYLGNTVAEQLGGILGSGLKLASLKKKSNLTQPMGVPVKSEFTHDAMGEPMDMSATAQAGSMGSCKKPAAKKDKKASEECETAMRGFLGTWNRSKDIHAKSAAYKNFMSRVGKFSSL